MPSIEFVSPIDQPVGKFRLLDWLDANFQSDDYNDFKCMVAFAKIKPFYKLHDSIQQWNRNGKQSELIFGIDHKGTSYQALQYALANFGKVHILHADYSTFHPKLFVFTGENHAVAYYGSSNFTSGGLETNFEGGTLFDFSFPQDSGIFNQLNKTITSLLPPSAQCTKLLTTDFLEALKQGGLLLDEANNSTISQRREGSRSGERTSSKSLFPSFAIKPAKAIPINLIASAASSAGIVLGSNMGARKQLKENGPRNVVAPALPVIIPLIIDKFIIQINPHRNGEIFLSKLAADQNGKFFGYPFSGHTIPKKSGNPSYPQRDPDPVVLIRVFDSGGYLVHTEPHYNLNTVFYEKNAEIRITITPSILSGLRFVEGSTDYPLLVMSKSSISGYDYEMDFYAMGSQEYSGYLSVCNQTLPSGGKPIARKMGWL